MNIFKKADLRLWQGGSGLYEKAITQGLTLIFQDIPPSVRK
ncbi:hypothetical protein [Ornithobacterium rhinotracheale]|nr:hypothetical protein [Ornithobacterium rhinotracheale]